MKKFISEGDEVLISTLEHHSNIIPWQIVCEQKKAKLMEIKPSDNGDITVDDVKRMISKNTKVIALPHITNSLGSLLPIKDICNEAKKHNIIKTYYEYTSNYMRNCRYHCRKFANRPFQFQIAT